MLPGFKAYLRNQILSITDRNKSREERLRDELRFWDRWMKTKGLEWPDQFRDRLNPDLPLAPKHSRLIDHLPQPELNILDVGAGPLTSVGKKHPQKRLTIHAVDVLAASYDELLARYGIQPPVRTVFAEAENLTHRFARDSFDFVNARNCLDHGVNPVAAIRQILLVTKKGCYALLEHIENEGEKQKYRGLHQWNFRIAGGDLIVTGREAETNVSSELADLGEFQCEVAREWVVASIRKK
jgi:SAM-dependent methyltransferase